MKKFRYDLARGRVMIEVKWWVVTHRVQATTALVGAICIALVVIREILK